MAIQRGPSRTTIILIIFGLILTALQVVRTIRINEAQSNGVGEYFLTSPDIVIPVTEEFVVPFVDQTGIVPAFNALDTFITRIDTGGETRRERYTRDGYWVDITYTSTADHCTGEVVTTFQYVDETGDITYDLIGSTFDHDGPCEGKDFSHAILEIVQEVEAIFTRLQQLGINVSWAERWLPFSRAMFALANKLARDLR